MFPSTKAQSGSSKKHSKSLLQHENTSKEDQEVSRRKKCPFCGCILGKEGRCPLCKDTKDWMTRYELSQKNSVEASTPEEETGVPQNIRSCVRCNGRIFESYVRTGGRGWWKVDVCPDCGWSQKKRTKSQKVPSYT